MILQKIKKNLNYFTLKCFKILIKNGKYDKKNSPLINMSSLIMHLEYILKTCGTVIDRRNRFIRTINNSLN